MTLSDFTIMFSATAFSVGQSYHFAVTNKGKVAHEFMIMPQGMDLGGMPMQDMHSQALMMIDTIAPGETRVVDFTFPTSGQQLEFACHLPGHYEAGMKLAIMVAK